MYIVFLRFGANRAQASQWMAEHGHWIQQGIEDGVFLVAGSLENSQGGAILATNIEKDALFDRVQQDPFVIHGVVVAEIHPITPSRVSPEMAEILTMRG